MSVKRIFVEKKSGFDVEAQGAFNDIRSFLGIASLEGLRIINRYDVSGLSDEDFTVAVNTVFSEPPVDEVSFEAPSLCADQKIFAMEYLPGQFDQRADSAAQCIQLFTQRERPVIRTAKLIILSGKVSDEELNKIKSYMINPVESREASLEPVDSLDMDYDIPTAVETLDGFIGLGENELREFVAKYGLAMDLDDIKFCQNYFISEQRDPTITEIRMIDTYWSDHCRHTTFLTNIDNVSIIPENIKRSYDKYLECRKFVYGDRDKPVSLMDLATIGAKYLKKKGLVPALDESEEINACSVKIDVDVNGSQKPYLLMFKNETHNHPTEIEPFGGAATCLGGAIRDPLSGRAYVYQAMRVTGAADPLTPVSETLPGKLHQKKLTTTAAAGYSSYGNQIGLATGHVSEIYHPGYIAKRMEIGAVIAAVPEENVVRSVPSPSDAVILLGGRTGRDGCGGATGSSKSHTLSSLSTCSAEVQKGNAPEERNLQRLVRNPKVSTMIKRCHDFGAGGVSVAVGELADGLIINLNAVTKKYEGLDGTDLAISESQERMAVVVDKNNVDEFIKLASKENLEATVVATVTEDPRLVMYWNDKKIVDISREFLNSNGASKHTDIVADSGAVKPGAFTGSTSDKFKALAGDLNVCSQKGLVERFDSTIGAGSVFMPFGGKHQLTPEQVMVAKIPLEKGDSSTCSLMSWGFNPFISSQNPYVGAMIAVTESVAKIIGAGGDPSKIWLTFQEYFGRTNNDPKRWGLPFMALLGAMEAQLQFEIASIGGKDSMSGTFEKIDVPPTLVSFAVSVSDVDTVIPGEFVKPDSKVFLISSPFNEDGTPDFDGVKKMFKSVSDFVRAKKARAVRTLSGGGVAEAVLKMALGNKLGFKFDKNISDAELFDYRLGFIIEADEAPEGAVLLGTTSSDYAISCNGSDICLEELQSIWENKLEPVFPTKTPVSKIKVPTFSFTRSGAALKPAASFTKPRVLVPVFPGSNCEYDTARQFEAAGAEAEIFVIRNLTASDISESADMMAKAIAKSQIIAIPGGFSGGDEPDGSAKFITSFFRNPQIKDAVHDLLKNRDGLMCGICNGFQALIKLGLVPYGEIRDMDQNSATLTFNTIGRHQSMLVRTRVASNKSPWLMNSNVGDIHLIAISHGEGRFIAPTELVDSLAANGQIATQYVDLSGEPTLDPRYNPNNSVCAIEGITSPDGRVFGKMGHTERYTNGVYKNVDGNKIQPIFTSAVEYFK